MEGPPKGNPKSQARTLLVICLTFIALIVVINILVLPNREFSVIEQGTMPLVVVGFVSLLIGAVYAQVKLRPKADDDDEYELPTYGRFMTDMLISLVLIELCALLGVFVVQNKDMVSLMTVAAIAVIALGVFPHVSQYAKAVGQKQ